MNVTRDVVLDLLPVYLAGEASDDTARLVQEFARLDATVAEMLRKGAHEPFGPAALSLPSPATDLELRALARTRRVLNWQRYLFGMGWFFAALSCSTVLDFENGSLKSARLLMADFPLQMGTLLALGLGCFAAHYWLRTRVRFKRSSRR